MAPSYGGIHHIYHRLKRIICLELKNNELSQDIEAKKGELEKIRNDLENSIARFLKPSGTYLHSDSFIKCVFKKLSWSPFTNNGKL